jgi:hypothetical protein
MQFAASKVSDIHHFEGGVKCEFRGPDLAAISGDLEMSSFGFVL